MLFDCKIKCVFKIHLNHGRNFHNKKLYSAGLEWTNFFRGFHKDFERFVSGGLRYLLPPNLFFGGSWGGSGAFPLRTSITLLRGLWRRRFVMPVACDVPWHPGGRIHLSKPETWWPSCSTRWFHTFLCSPRSPAKTLCNLTFKCAFFLNKRAGV